MALFQRTKNTPFLFRKGQAGVFFSLAIESFGFLIILRDTRPGMCAPSLTLIAEERPQSPKREGVSNAYEIAGLRPQ